MSEFLRWGRVAAIGTRLATKRPVAVSIPWGVVGVAAAFPVLVTSPYWQLVVSQAGIYVIAAMGLNMLTGYAGHVSIAQGAMMAVGAYTCGILTVSHGWNVWLSIGAAVVVSGLVGALLCLPALRLSAWYFAVITLVFAEVVNGLLVQMTGLTGGGAGLIGIPPLEISGMLIEGRRFFWLVLVVLVAVFIVVQRLVKSKYGRGLVAIRDNQAAAVTSGISVPRAKFLVFAFGSMLAGLAGALFAVQAAVLTPDVFGVNLSVFLLVAVVLGGSGRLWGPVVGGLAFFVGPQLLSSLSEWRTLVYGVGLLVLIVFAPEGIAGFTGRHWDRFTARLHRAAASQMSNSALPDVAGMHLQLDGIRKCFGGVAALDNVSLTVEAGSIQAIVGPNGSGKTTLVNVITGFYSVDAGAVLCDEQRVSGQVPNRLARLGVVRTFQTPRLLPNASVLDNVILGAYTSDATSLVGVVLALPRARRSQNLARERARTLLGTVGISSEAWKLASELPHGQQRLLEIARALMMCPRLLLLDEPAAGLSLSELDALATLIRKVSESGVTIVIVEHHIDLIAALAGQVAVLDHGQLLAVGPPSEVFGDEAVRAAYLGRR